MTGIKAKTPDVLSAIRTAFLEEAQAAAGTNKLISKAEQSTLRDDVLAIAANEIRAKGGPGTTVNVDVLVETASSHIATLLGQVNQPSGVGAGFVSESEVKALAANDPQAGRVVARAYEIITGRAITLPDSVVVPVDPVVPPPTTAARLAIDSVTLTDPGMNPVKLKMNIIDGGAIEISGTASPQANIHINLGGRIVTPTLTGTSHDKRRVIEVIRNSVPDLDVRVTAFAGTKARIEFWPKDSAPPLENGPVYAQPESSLIYALAPAGTPPDTFEIETTGALSMKSGDRQLLPGSWVRVRVDNKMYEVSRSTPCNLADLYRDLKAKLATDGIQAQHTDYPSGLQNFRILPG